MGRLPVNDTKQNSGICTQLGVLGRKLRICGEQGVQGRDPLVQRNKRGPFKIVRLDNAGCGENLPDMVFAAFEFCVCPFEYFASFALRYRNEGGTQPI